MRIAIAKPKSIANSEAIENNSNFVIYLIFILTSFLKLKNSLNLSLFRTNRTTPISPNNLLFKSF